MDRKRRGLLILGVLAIAVLALIWVPRGQRSRRTIPIGVVLPLTGSAADQGKDILSGIGMARDEIVANLSSGEPAPDLIVEDDLSTPRGGVSALEKITQTRHAPIVIGPIASSIMLAMIPIAERRKVVILSPAASSPKISNSSKYAFRISLLADPQARALAQYARARLKAERAAILYSNDETGLSYKEAFQKAFTEVQGKIVHQDSYDRTGTDFRAELAKLQPTRAQITFLAGVPQTIGLILRQARELGVETQFLGNYGVEGANLFATGGNSVEGLVYASIPISQAFIQSFRTKFGRAPTIGAPLGYDALRIAWHVIQSSGVSAEAVRQGLATLRDYPGVSGRTSILPSGDAEKEVCLKKVSQGTFTVIDNN